ncbi:MAG: hypothetical protein UV09_C0003G0036 [Candidatus Gottesmanbacteria bacterium GW2011_GWA2_42_18]|uniref:OmpR/PhoB-type domain-containing protein n=1 Tax=Candidatus Gottesmanbacteria bacterium GW2011_GWA2_42_18 TaxID=1618442 RepID=A0A0G1BN32_9BACT|nr:MAG: hypothetical protein UV09_C0003G0036 [Candidatus Gottesmanbacteria bacterium GW2011_GWA2_42_18]
MNRTAQKKQTNIGSENARQWWSIFSTAGYKDPNKCLTDLTVKTIEANAKKWLNIIRYTESGTIIQLQDDCEYSVTEVINNKHLLRKYFGPYYRKYLLKYIPIDQKDLLKTINESLVELYLSRKIGHKKSLNSLSNIELLNLIAGSGYEVGFDDKYKVLADKCSFLFDHIIKYPLYDEPDVLQFINFYCDLWNVTLPEKTAKEIYRICGGYHWLVHQAIRNLRDDFQLSVYEACTDILLLNKLEVIWGKFTAEEKNIIRKIYLGNIEQTDSLTHEYEYLKSIRVIIEKSDRIELGLPLLSKIIEKEMKLDIIHVKHDQIMLGKNNLTNTLTNKEKLLMLLLLNSKKKIISREVIAQTIWGDCWEEKYSDWAIDVLAHRVRKKLNAVGIDENLLKTVKKKGFVFG